MPFSLLHLKGPRPRSLPRGYPARVKTLGDHIRRKRLDHGLGQRILARELGVRAETLGRWEKGLSRPLPTHYGKIIRFLGCDPEAGDLSMAGRLRAARRRLGLSQAVFASKVGLDEGSVRRWESGPGQPSRWMEPRLRAILEGLEAPDAAVAEVPNSFFALTRARRRLPPSGQAIASASYGDLVRLKRLRAGLTQTEVGLRLGVDPSTVRRWERGQSFPVASRRAAIVTLLGALVLPDPSRRGGEPQGCG